MDERVEAKYQVNALVGNHRQCHAVIDCKGGMRLVRESIRTGTNTALRQIYPHIRRALRNQVLRPASVARSDLQYRGRGEERRDARPDAGDPLRLRSAPGAGPFIAALGPVVSLVPLVLIPGDCRHNSTLHY